MMNVTDYNKKLADIKSAQAQDNQEVRETYKKDLSDIKSRDAENRKNQFENYKKERLADEAATKSRIAEYDEKIESEINEKTKRFSDRLEEERSKYSRANASELSRYNKKLGQLSESFESSDREREMYNDQVKKQSNKQYTNNLKARETQFRDSVNSLSESTNQKVSELKNQQESEKTNMNNRHSSETKRIIENNSKYRNLSKTLHQEELDKIRNNSSDHLASQKANHELTVKNIKESEALGRKDLVSTYSDLTNKLQEKNTKSTKDVNIAKKELSSEANRKVASIRLESSKKESLREMPSDTQERFSPLGQIKKSYEARVDHLKNTITENNMSNELVNKKAAENQKIEMRDMTAANNKEKETLIKDLNRDRQLEVGTIKDRFNNYEVESKRVNRDLSKQIEESAIESKQDKNDSLSRQKLGFENKMTIINDSNQDLLSAIKEDMAKEQTKVFQKAKKDKHEEIRDLKADLNHSFSLKKASLDKQIESKDHKIEDITKTYDTKMEALKKMTQDRVEAIRSHEEDRRIEDRLAVQREMKLQQIEFDKVSSTMRNEFDSKLTKAKNSNDIQVMKLTRRYEDMLRTERTNFSKEQSRRQSQMNSELRNLQENTAAERENLIKQYEVKLSKLRDANKVANELKSMRDSNPDIS